MAIDPSTEYPGQIDADANYPFGKARNVNVAGDGTGTPWEERLVNDIFGFQQALLDAANATPTGTPDSVAASQYLEAARILPFIGRFDIPLIAATNFDARFQADEIDFGNYHQVDITDAGELDFHLSLPKVGTLKIDELHAIVSGTGNGGAHAALPANLPTLYMKRRTGTVGGTYAAAATLANETDASANVAAYNLIHLISATGLAHTILADSIYSVGFTGESGANSEVNKLVLMGLYLVLTP